MGNTFQRPYLDALKVTPESKIFLGSRTSMRSIRVDIWRVPVAGSLVRCFRPYVSCKPNICLCTQLTVAPI